MSNEHTREQLEQFLANGNRDQPLDASVLAGIADELLETVEMSDSRYLRVARPSSSSSNWVDVARFDLRDHTDEPERAMLAVSAIVYAEEVTDNTVEITAALPGPNGMRQSVFRMGAVHFAATIGSRRPRTYL